jgi:integrase
VGARGGYAGSHYRPSPERWLSGRKRRFAKPLGGETCLGGSNPPLSALEPSGAARTRPKPAIKGVLGVGKGRLEQVGSPYWNPSELSRLALARRIEARGPPLPRSSPPLDPGAAESARLTGEGVARIVRALGHRAGLARPVRPHGLRHASINHALDLGRDLGDARQFSRHKNIKTLMVYDARRRNVGGEIARQLAGR